MNITFKSRISFIALVCVLLLIVITGCESDDEDERRYPPPGEGHTAVIDIDHRQESSQYAAMSYADVEVYIDEQPIVNTTVTLNNILLPFNSSTNSYTQLITQPFNEDESIKVLIKSMIWGEDSTYINIPERIDGLVGFSDFSISADSIITFSWEECRNADSYILYLRHENTNTIIFSTPLSDTHYTWNVQEYVVGEIFYRITAIGEIDDAPVFSGDVTLKREGIFTISE